MSNSTETSNAYVTLLTRPSYLAGALLLAYTLTKHSPNTPLIITYTPETLSEPFIQAFRDEAKYSNIILHAVEHLRLPEDGTEHGMVAERFIDTWSKLRVFDLYDLKDTHGKPFERLCWLDADMTIFSDPSPWIFTPANDEYLNSGDGMNLMAVHTCVCNLDHDAWAPKEWIPENCALTPLTSPDQNATVKAEPYTLSNFNSGTFLWRNSKAMSQFVQRRFKEVGNANLRKMKFPDQDFLNEAFDGRWRTLNWRTNALKTWRYWHPNVWKNDKDVAVLHYIVDKPWAARVNPNGTAGYLSKDGETHKWWWDEYFRWEAQRKEQGEQELLRSVGKYVAGEAGEVDEEMARSVGGGAQGFAKKWGSKNEENDEEPENFGQGPSGPILRKPVFGERGHGPVVNKRGPGANGGWSVMDA